MRFSARRFCFILAVATLLCPSRPAAAQKEVLEEVALSPTDSTVFCQTGDRLLIKGSFAMPRDYDNCLFCVDNAVVSQRGPTLGRDDYAFPWTATAPSAHLVQIYYTMQPQGKALARRMWINVSVAPPAALHGLPAQAVADTLVTAAGTDPHSFPLARVDFYFQGKPVASATSPPFSATLPIEAVTDAGTYPVKFVAYDTAGHPFHSHTFQMEVPQRVQPLVAADLTVQKAEDRPTVAVTILPGVKAARANYWIAPSGGDDWQALAESTSPSFSSPADLSRYPTGSYRLKVKVTSPAGAVYESQVADFTFKNGPDDERQAKEAKDKADADAILAKRQAEVDAKQAAIDHVTNEEAANLQNFYPRPGFDAAIFRQQAADLAYYEPEKRRGAVGTVHGLSVLTRDDVPVIGRPTTVTALVRSGSGQVTFLAYSADDARIAAQQAAEYCKMATGSYFRWDWTKYDLTVGYLENEAKNSGPSAGLADSVAIMSAAVNLPVDDSVAMTGAITLQGQVKAVGRVDYKAESAFRDTNVHTLIIPAEAVPVADLVALYTSEPALCFNRRIVLVRTVDDALRESIVGWQRGDYLKAEKLVQGGMRHFARGEDDLALAAFHAAHDLDPNNWTVTYWIALVGLTRQESRNDAALKATVQR